MTWLLAVCMICLWTELFLRLPIARSTSLVVHEGAQARRILSSRNISDHWKEKMARVYAGRMGRETLRLVLCFGVLAIAVIAPLHATTSVARLLSTVAGVTCSMVIPILYWLMKRRLVRYGL